VVDLCTAVKVCSLFPRMCIAVPVMINTTAHREIAAAVLVVVLIID